MLSSQVNCITANQSNDQDLQENLKTINPIMIIRFSYLIISWKAVVLRKKKYIYISGFHGFWVW